MERNKFERSYRQNDNARSQQPDEANTNQRRSYRPSWRDGGNSNLLNRPPSAFHSINLQELEENRKQAQENEKMEDRNKRIRILNGEKYLYESTQSAEMIESHPSSQDMPKSPKPPESSEDNIQSIRENEIWGRIRKNPVFNGKPDEYIDNIAEKMIKDFSEKKRKVIENNEKTIEYNMDKAREEKTKKIKTSIHAVSSSGEAQSSEILAVETSTDLNVENDPPRSLINRIGQYSIEKINRGISNAQAAIDKTITERYKKVEGFSQDRRDTLIELRMLISRQGSEDPALLLEELNELEMNPQSSPKLKEVKYGEHEKTIQKESLIPADITSNSAQSYWGKLWVKMRNEQDLGKALDGKNYGTDIKEKYRKLYETRESEDKEARELLKAFIDTKDQINEKHTKFNDLLTSPNSEVQRFLFLEKKKKHEKRQVESSTSTSEEVNKETRNESIKASEE